MAYLYIAIEKLKSHPYLMTLDVLKRVGYKFEKKMFNFYIILCFATMPIS